MNPHMHCEYAEFCVCAAWWCSVFACAVLKLPVVVAVALFFSPPHIDEWLSDVWLLTLLHVVIAAQGLMVSNDSTHVCKSPVLVLQMSHTLFKQYWN